MQKIVKLNSDWTEECPFIETAELCNEAPQPQSVPFEKRTPALMELTSCVQVGLSESVTSSVLKRNLRSILVGENVFRRSVSFPAVQAVNS